MSNNSQKLKQRAELISILNTYRNIAKIDNLKLKDDINRIATIDDKNFVFKTLINEISSSKSIYSDICSIIIFEAIEKDLFEEFSIKLLQDKKTTDEKKLLIMSLMKQKGLDFNYRDVVDYVDNPEELAHSGVKDFLHNALIDPEVQLDLLDFYINIPTDEKNYFLENLETEFDGDNLANAFSLLIQLNLENNDEFTCILNVLLNSDSPYALIGLNHVLENKKLDAKTKAKIKRTIKKINEIHPDFSNDFLVKNSSIYKTYISFVDGKSEFSLIFSRKTKDNLINLLLLTINLSAGIKSCMGFSSIEKENFQSIIKRLFSDSIPININTVAFKSLYQHYLSKTKNNNFDLPYELIVWKNLLNDVRTINFDISEFINSKLNITELTKSKIKKFINSKVVETWFYSYGENEYIDKIIDRIENEHCLDLDKINEWTNASIQENFISNIEYIKELQSKLLLQAYISSLAKLEVTSSCAYSMCFKTQYLKILILSIIDKSIYHAFAFKLNQLDENNIFRKKPLTSFSEDELEILLAQFEEKWK